MLHQVIMFHYFIAAFVTSIYEPEKKNNEQDWLQVVCNLKSPKNFTCPLGKLRTEFTTLIAKFTGHRSSDNTFFALNTTHHNLCALHTTSISNNTRYPLDYFLSIIIILVFLFNFNSKYLSTEAFSEFILVCIIWRTPFLKKQKK